MNSAGHELEVKFLLSRPGAFEDRLGVLGAQLLHPRVHEINLRFDTPDGALTSRAQVLRLRRDHQTTLTYKGPGETQAGVRKRREIEFTISDYQAAQALLEALGYRVLLMYEKHRTTYAWQGVLIVLDEMPYGNFAEIEGPDPELIHTTSAHLGMAWEARLLDSYTMLFDKLRGVYAFTFRDLSFANFAGLDVDWSALGIPPADL